MGIKDGIIAELKHEAASTQKMLERIPTESFSFKPHEKSRPIANLATHVALTPRWISNILAADDYDFANDKQPRTIATTNEELMSTFTEVRDKAIADLEAASDADFDKIWTVRSGEKVFFQLPKKVAIRSWGLSHLVHHRGQLSVYLRLLNIPVPGMYGPSADETM